MQTYKNIELIIVDDASTDDGTRQIMKDLAKIDCRVRTFYSEKRLGAPNAKNFCLNQAKGKYVAIQDSDDFSVKNRIQLQVEYLESHTDIDILGTNYMYQDYEWKTYLFNFILPKEHETIKMILPFNNVLMHSSIMVRREKLKHELHYEDLKYGADYDLWLDLIYNRPELNIKVSIHPEKLVYYLVHTGSMSS